MQKEDIIIRRIQLSDLIQAMRLSTQQGWNQTETDWKWIIENPQNICLLAEFNGKVIGTTAAMNYSNDVAWINMVLVDKEFRGLGISKLLLENIFKKLTHVKSIKLDATPEGQRVYRQFNFFDEYSISRMMLPSAKHSPNEGERLPEPIHSNNIPEIIAFDKHVFGASRNILIESLIKVYPQKAWMLKRNDAIIGFILGRDGRKHQHIGPVMASTLTDAKVLIEKVLMESEGKPIVADVLADKTELVNWLGDIGFIHQRFFMRMFLSVNPFPGNTKMQFSICGPEFG
jgi:GNAT superfamily N-acetyltransferase